MKKKLINYGIFLWILYAAYAFISYLLLLRDDFILERIAFLTEKPWVLEQGRRYAKFFHVNSIPTILYFIVVIALFLIYLRVLQLIKRSGNKKGIRKVILWFSLVFMLTTFISFPALSTDIFDYIASNRVLFEHKSNPWLHAPQAFPQDEFIYLGSWKFRASVYGPVQFIFSSLVHLLARDNLIINIIGFKITNLAFTLATIFLIYKWLKRNAPSYGDYGLVLFAWNPLLIIEIIGNAHNDIIMAFFTILSIYWISEKRETLSALALAVATLAKLAASLFVPLILVWLLINKKKKQSLKFISVFLFTGLLGFASLGQGLKGFLQNISVQFNLYLRSLPTITRFIFLKSGFTDSLAKIAEKLITIPPFLLLYGLVIKRIKEYGLIAAMVAAMMIYLIITAPMLQPWYLVWFLPLVALLPPSRLQFAALAFTFSSLMYYTILFVSFYFSPLLFAWQVVMFIFIIFLPVFVWFAPKTWYTQLTKYLR